MNKLSGFGHVLEATQSSKCVPYRLLQICTRIFVIHKALIQVRILDYPNWKFYANYNQLLKTNAKPKHDCFQSNKGAVSHCISGQDSSCSAMLSRFYLYTQVHIAIFMSKPVGVRIYHFVLFHRSC